MGVFQQETQMTVVNEPLPCCLPMLNKNELITVLYISCWKTINDYYKLSPTGKNHITYMTLR